MKEYVKKTAVIFLVISMLITTINPLAYISIANDIIDEVETSEELDQTVDDVDEENEEETADEDISNESDSDVEGTEESNDVAETENEISEEANNDEVEDEPMTMADVAVFAAEMPDEETDFTWYYVGDEDNKNYCNQDTINDVIATATGDMVIELNRDIELQDGIIIENKINVDLNLNGKTIDMKSTSAQIIRAISGKTVTVYDGIIKGGNTTNAPQVTNNAKKKGATIYSEKTKIVLNNLCIKDSTSPAQGGGVFVSGTSLADVILEAKNCTFDNNTSNQGGAINCTLGKVIIDTCTFTNNNASTGAGIYCSGNLEIKANGNGEYTKFENNGLTKASKGSAIQVTSYCKDLSISDTIISGNKTTSASDGGVIYANGLYQGKVTLKNVTIKENNAIGVYIIGESEIIKFEDVNIENNQKIGCLFEGAYYGYMTINCRNTTIIGNGSKENSAAGGILVGGCTITLTDSIVENNSGKKAGAISITDYETCNVVLENTIIRNNEGVKVGGINLYNDWGEGNSLEIKSNSQGKYGAIYGNTAEDTVSGTLKAYDIYASYCKVNLPSADVMADEEKGISFDNKSWIRYREENNFGDEPISGSVKDNFMSSDKSRVYNVGVATERYVARLEKNDGTQERYLTISDAINDAENGEKIVLIAGDGDETSNVINENIEINNKNITFNLNNRILNSSADLEGSAMTISNNANVTVIGAGRVENIDVAKGNLNLKSTAEIDTIEVLAGGIELNADVNFGLLNIGSGVTVKTGENFPTDTISNDMNMIVAQEDISRLDNENVKIIETTNKLSDEIVNKIKVKDLGETTEIVTDENDDIYLSKIAAIYVDGVNGSDSNSGNSEVNAVKTIEKAIELYNANKDNVEFIWVIGTVTVDGEETISGQNNEIITRHPNFKGNLIDVKGTLTVKDITLDGANYEVNNALIKVSENGKLIIEDGAKLINNNSTGKGGAVYCNNGTVEMNGGLVSGNTAEFGGGIDLDGTSATMTLNDGTISNNKTINTSNGAGIAVFDGASLTMNGGSIIRNNSMGPTGTGAGIYVGGFVYNHTMYASHLVMNNGLISENTAKMSGGGIYIECESDATLYAGVISKNQCGIQGIFVGDMQGMFGGAGIYVNGGKTDIDGKLYLPNAYIANNTAAWQDGAAIAACPTSTTIIYPEAATISNNIGSSQIYVDNSKSLGYGVRADIDISDITVGEGNNNWTDKNGNVISEEQLHKINAGEKLYLKNDNASNTDANGEKSPLKIIDNISFQMGGGIGSNGHVQIGGEINIDIDVEKTWVDGDNADKVRPESITVNLFKDGEFVESKTVSEENDWKCTFENLPKYDGDNKIEYTITEDNVDGYNTQIDGFHITNTQLTDVTVYKVWKDNNNENGLRPSSVTIKLMANGKEIRTRAITAKDNWEYTFENLMKYDENGNEIIYTIEEDEVKGYETEIYGNIIVNTLVVNNDENDDKENVEKDDIEKEENLSVKTADYIYVSYAMLSIATIIGVAAVTLKRSSK